MTTGLKDIKLDYCNILSRNMALSEELQIFISAIGDVHDEYLEWKKQTAFNDDTKVDFMRDEFDRIMNKIGVLQEFSYARANDIYSLNYAKDNELE